MNKCKATKRDSTPCNAWAIDSSEYCFFHDPDKETERRQASLAGGRNRLRTLDYLLVQNGHMISRKNDECILCNDGESPYCIHAVSQDELTAWMDSHPYVYLLQPATNALNSDYYWFGVRDTRSIKNAVFDIYITTHLPTETDPPLPKPAQRDGLSLREIKKLLG